MNKKVYASIFGLVITIAFPAAAISKHSPLVQIMAAAKATVMIKAESGGVYGGGSQAFLDPKSGRIIQVRSIKPIYHKREGVGVIVDASGIIVTMAHTVKEAGRITVTLHDETEVIASVAHMIPERDLAFLHVDPPDELSSIPIAESNEVRIGAEVYSIGGSQLLSNTIIGGRIKAVGKSKRLRQLNRDLVDLLQIDFDVYRGDSGSPILDDSGKLLGLILGGEVHAEKSTFAIPSHFIREHLQEYQAQSKRKSPVAMSEYSA